jgi:hypothetical protein
MQPIAANTLEIVRVEYGRGEQEVEIIHADSRTLSGKGVGAFDDSWMTERRWNNSRPVQREHRPNNRHHSLQVSPQQEQIPA